MKSKDQQLLEEAYQSIRESQKLGKMTPQQEHVYSRWTSAGWEFEMWDGEDVIMQRWDRSLDGASRLASMRIKPDGEHYREKFNSSEDQEEKRKKQEANDQISMSMGYL